MNFMIAINIFQYGIYANLWRRKFIPFSRIKPEMLTELELLQFIGKLV